MSTGQVDLDQLTDARRAQLKEMAASLTLNEAAYAVSEIRSIFPVFFDLSFLSTPPTSPVSEDADPFDMLATDYFSCD